MISFTIKTLDSINHGFSVDNEMTIAQLKELIHTKIGFAIETQRLIFCGRVLTDDQKISDLDVDGKVVHLVPRPPPCLQQRTSSQNPRDERDPSAEPQLVNDRVNQGRQSRNYALPLNTPSRLVLDQEREMALSPVAARLDFIRRMLQDIRASLLVLDCINTQSNPNYSVMSSSSDIDQPLNESASTAEGQAHEVESSSHGSNDSAFEMESNSSNNPRRILARPRDFADLLDELETLWERFAFHRTTYTSILRNNKTQGLSREQRDWQRNVMRHCNRVMHSAAHAYHAAADVEVARGNVMLLTAGSSRDRQQIPIQQINVFPSRRADAAAAGGAPPGPSFTRVRAHRINTDSPSSTDPNTPTSNSDGQNQQPGEPVTYQVEIETRMPIALPLDAEFLTNLAAAAPVDPNRGRQEQGHGQGQNQPQGQPQGQNQPQGQSQGQTQFGQDPTGQQGIQARGLIDIENLLRTLSQNNPGVEVVMSMEEVLPTGVHANVATELNAAAFGNRGPNDGGATGTTPAPGPSVGAGMTFGPFGISTATTGTTGNGAQTTGNTGANTNAGPGIHIQGLNFGPLLGPSFRNSYSTSMPVGPDYGPSFGPFIGPATFTFQPDGGVVLEPTAANNAARAAANEHLHNFFTHVVPPTNAPSTTNAAPSNTTGPTPVFVAPPAAFPMPTSSAYAASAVVNNAVPSNAPQNARRPSEGPRRMGLAGEHTRLRHSHTRAHLLAEASMTYDRFLNCYSVHARERLNERRQEYRNLYNQQLRQIANRRNPLAIYRLQEWNSAFTSRHMATMMRLINGPTSAEGLLNAFLVTVARMMFLNCSPRYHLSPDTMSPPREFHYLRHHIREHLQRVIDLVTANGGQRNLFDRVVNVIIAQNLPSLQRALQCAPVEREEELVADLRQWLNSHLPVLVASVMPESPSDGLIVNFYFVVTMFFKELCAFIARRCENDYDGLRAIFAAFIEELTESFEAGNREWLRLLAHENVSPLGVQKMDVDEVRDDTEAAEGLNELSTATPQETPSSVASSLPVQHEQSVLDGLPAATIQFVQVSSDQSAFAVVNGDGSDGVPSSIGTPTHTVHLVSSPPSLSAQSAAVIAGESASMPVNSQIEDSEPSSPGTPTGEPACRVWDELWLPVFSRDQRLQREAHRRPVPYSDGYIAAMPARKRRCLQAARPPTSLDGFLNENVRAATGAGGASSADMSEVRRRLVYSVGSALEARVNSSEDFDPERYPATATLIARTKRTGAEDKPGTSAEKEETKGVEK